MDGSHLDIGGRGEAAVLVKVKASSFVGTEVLVRSTELLARVLLQFWS